MIFLYCYVEYVTIQYGANFICKVAHFRSTSFALTICWAQTSAGSGPEVAHFGPLLGRPYFGPLTVHFGPLLCHTPWIVPSGRVCNQTQSNHAREARDRDSNVLCSAHSSCSH